MGTPVLFLLAEEALGAGVGKLLAGSPGKGLIYMDLESTLPVAPESLWGLPPKSPLTSPPPSSCHPQASSGFLLDQATPGLILKAFAAPLPEGSASRYSLKVSFLMSGPLAPALCFPGWHTAPSNLPSICLFPLAVV